MIISGTIRGLYQLTSVVEDRDGEHVANGPAQQPALATIKDHLESINGIFKPGHIILFFDSISIIFICIGSEKMQDDKV